MGFYPYHNYDVGLLIKKLNPIIDICNIIVFMAICLECT